MLTETSGFKVRHKGNEKISVLDKVLCHSFRMYMDYETIYAGVALHKHYRPRPGQHFQLMLLIFIACIPYNKESLVTAPTCHCNKSCLHIYFTLAMALDLSYFHCLLDTIYIIMYTCSYTCRKISKLIVWSS